MNRLPIIFSFLVLAAFPVQAQRLPDQVLAGPGLMHLREPPRFAYGSVEGDWISPNGWLGTWVSVDGGGKDNFIGAGPLLKAALGRGWTFLGGAGPGVCSGDATDQLGYRFEFRSSAYLCRTLDRKHALILSVSHYSNGGMSRRNPGVEGMRILYMIHLDGPKA